MAKVTDVLRSTTDRPVFVIDFTPPRGGDPSMLDRLGGLRADFVSVAYNPGKLVRADSVAVARAIRERLGLDVVVNLSPRDMNKIALESCLLGAQMLGLENVVALQGDPLGEREAAHAVSGVHDYTATQLISAMRSLNDGADYRGGKLQASTNLCIGAVLNPSADLEREVWLTLRKVAAGAEFFLSQAVYDLGRRDEFLEQYERIAGKPLDQPVFWGVQVLHKEGVLLGDLPQKIKDDLEGGRSGTDIAIEQVDQLRKQGVRSIYLVAPILKGGARDYDAAKQVLEAVVPRQ